MTIYCIVPSCKKSRRNNPCKIFFNVPHDQIKRNLWLEAIGVTKTHYSYKSHLYVCEDHFNVQEDLENYLEYKIMGGNKRMKPNVVPHLSIEPAKTEIIGANKRLKPNVDPHVPIKSAETINKTYIVPHIEHIILKPDVFLDIAQPSTSSDERNPLDISAWSITKTEDIADQFGNNLADATVHVKSLQYVPIKTEDIQCSLQIKTEIKIEPL